MSSFWIPWPPTSNTMFGLKGHHRFVSKTYADWKDTAGEHLMQQRPDKFDEPVCISIRLRAPTKRKWDIDNRVKPILDLLVSHQIIADDNSLLVRRIDVRADDYDAPGAHVTIEPAAAMDRS